MFDAREYKMLDDRCTMSGIACPLGNSPFRISNFEFLLSFGIYPILYFLWACVRHLTSVLYICP